MTYDDIGINVYDTYREEVLYKYFQEGYDEKEISEEMNLSVSEVQRLIDERYSEIDKESEEWTLEEYL